MNEWNEQIKWNGILADAWYAGIHAECTLRTHTHTYILHTFCCDCVSIILWNMVYVWNGMKCHDFCSEIRLDRMKWPARIEYIMKQCTYIHFHIITHNLFNWSWFILISLVIISHNFHLLKKVEILKSYDGCQHFFEPSSFLFLANNNHKQIETYNSIIIKLNLPVVVSHAKMSKRSPHIRLHDAHSTFHFWWVC